MKLEVAAIDWDSHHETTYDLILTEEQVSDLAAGYVPRVVKAMAIDVLHFRDADEARAAANVARATRSAKPKRKTA